MKKGLMILVALSIALLMNASMLVAQEKAPAGKEMASCGKEMKLTDEQKTKLEELKMSFRLKMVDLKAEREKLGIMLKKEMMKPEPAMNDIEGIVKKMSAVREKIQLTAIEHMLAVRKIVGPEACKGMHCGMGMGCGMQGNHMMRMRIEAPGCAMEKGAGKEGCGAEGMKGGCPMGKNAAAGCPMEGTGKEIKCKMEIKEEAKKK